MFVASLIILVIWVTVYLVLTKHLRIKRSIKLFLRTHFDDVDEKIWSVLISLWYDFFPFLCLVFIPGEFRQQLFLVAGYAFPVLIASGVIGFYASLTITSLCLDVAHFGFGLRYEAMSGVTWINQTKKISSFFGVMAAITEEFFLRYLPAMLYTFRHPSQADLLLGLVISSLIFTLLQLAYVETKLQSFVLLIASLSISLVSILLILDTGHILPSLIMHAAYVGFFLSGKEVPAATRQTRLPNPSQH